MFDKVTQSWKLAGQCWRVLKQDPALMLFPLMSAAALILLLASFAAPVLAVAHHVDPIQTEDSTTHTAWLVYYVMLGAFYLVTYSVMMFFNTAMIAVALRRLDGEDASIGEGLRLAWGNLASILVYAAIAATIGAIIRSVEERVGFIGRIVAGLIGAGWSIASSMTLPVLVVEKLGPVEAISRSLELMRCNWGENIVGSGGIGLAVAVIAVPTVVPAYILMRKAFATNELSHIIPAFMLMAAILLGVGVARSTLHAIYTAALYRFATGAKDNNGIDEALLADAFRPK